MSTIVVDYDAGNLRSVETALAHLGADFTVTSDPDVVRRASRIVFPGVGDGAHAMRVLAERGLVDAMHDGFRSGVPILGICVGCQIVLDRTEEHDARCLGLIPGVARRFVFAHDAEASGGSERIAMDRLKIPHMGWNQVDARSGHWLFDGVPERSSFYFVHSYYPDPVAPADEIAHTEYGITFASALERDNLVAVQFHPEKSGPVGLRVLGNFLERR